MTNIKTANHALRAGYAALAGIALFAAVPAAADSPRQERVAYGDLDLTSEAGQTTLNKRIQAAVKRVCDSRGGSLAEFAAFNRCKRESLAGATAQMEVAIARAGVGRTGIAANMAIGAHPVGKP